MLRRDFCKTAAVGAACVAVASASTLGGTASAHPGTIPVVTTRGHFDVSWSWSFWNDGFYEDELVDGHSKYDYGIDGRIPVSADELVVLVHGWSNDPFEAAAVFETMSDNLRAAGFRGPMVGFSYDASVDFQQIWQVGKWWAHYDVAQRNGPKLAHFIYDLPDDQTVRLVGHSLGAQPMLNALVTLNRVPTVVDSVSMLGGATGDGSVSTHGAYGEYIQRNTREFHNYYMDDDLVLDGAFAIAELDQAAGEEGCDGPEPWNYEDHDVGDTVDSHSGYYKRTGCLDQVVADW